MRRDEGVKALIDYSEREIALAAGVSNVRVHQIKEKGHVPDKLDRALARSAKETL